MSGAGFAATSRHIGSEKTIRKLGTAWVQLEQLDFPHSKHLDPKNVERLKALFRGEGGCRPADVDNRIPAIIDRTLFVELLDRSSISASVISADVPEHPKLDLVAGSRLECLRGRHRVSAAHEVLKSGEKRWVVDFFASDITEDAKRDLIEEYSNAKTPDDGEFYYKIRQYQGVFGRPEPYFERRWWACLASARESSNKKTRLEQLFKHPKFAPAFDAFRHLRALYVGLRISVLNKIISMGCTEELLTALRGLKTFWYDLFANDENAMERLDPETVIAVENKAPGASSADAEQLRELARAGQIFCDFSEQERLVLLDRLCRATKNRLIPSLYAFFENQKYLQVVSDSLKRLVRLRSRESLRAALEGAFSDEVHEGHFCQIQVSPTSARLIASDGADRFDLAYRQLWLYALREYPEMPAEKKQKLAGPRGAKADERVLYHFASLAYSLGFRTPEIQNLRQQDPDREMARRFLTTARRPEQYEFDDFEARVEQVAIAISAAHPIPGPEVTHGFDFEPDEHSFTPNRCGLPKSVDQPRDKALMFLNVLHGPIGEQRPILTSFFIQRSFYFSFWGENISVDVEQITTAPSAELFPPRSQANDERRPENAPDRGSRPQRDEGNWNPGMHGTREREQSRIGGLAVAEAMQRKTLEQLAANEREKRASLENLEAEEQRLMARVNEMQATIHHLNTQEQSLREAVSGHAATSKQMEAMFKQTAEDEEKGQARLERMEERAKQLQHVVGALETKEREQRLRMQHSAKGLNNERDKPSGQEPTCQGGFGEASVQGHQTRRFPSSLSDQEKDLNEAAQQTRAENERGTGRSGIRITFKELRNSVWVKAHDMLVDPGDPSEVRRVAIKYMRKGFAVMSSDDRALRPEICFDVASSDGTNTIHIARAWEIETAARLPEAHDRVRKSSKRCKEALGSMES